MNRFMQVIIAVVVFAVFPLSSRAETVVKAVEAVPAPADSVGGSALDVMATQIANCQFKYFSGELKANLKNDVTGKMVPLSATFNGEVESFSVVWLTDYVANGKPRTEPGDKLPGFPAPQPGWHYEDFNVRVTFFASKAEGSTLEAWFVSSKLDVASPVTFTLSGWGGRNGLVSFSLPEGLSANQVVLIYNGTRHEYDSSAGGFWVWAPLNPYLADEKYRIVDACSGAIVYGGGTIWRGMFLPPSKKEAGASYLGFQGEEGVEPLLGDLSFEIRKSQFTTSLNVNREWRPAKVFAENFDIVRLGTDLTQGWQKYMWVSPEFTGDIYIYATSGWDNKLLKKVTIKTTSPGVWTEISVPMGFYDIKYAFIGYNGVSYQPFEVHFAASASGGKG